MSNEPSPEQEIDLLDYVSVLVRRRRMILRNVVVASVIAAAVSLLLPQYFEAVTTLLPPDNSDQSLLRTMVPDGVLPFLGMAGGVTNGSLLFVEILRSRTVGEGVLQATYDYRGERKTLLQIWEAPSLGKALRRLYDRTRISANDQGIVSIAVELRDRSLAAQVANQFAAELDRVNREKSVSRAKSSRIYIEEQLRLTEAELQKAQQALADFQRQNKAVSLAAQTEAMIERAAEIKGTIMALEVERNVLLKTHKPTSPRVLQTETRLDQLRKQYLQLQFGNGVQPEGEEDYFIPFADLPELGRRLADLTREVKVQEKVWELLTQQYHQARIQEARDTPTVQVLDVAVPPEQRSRPKRKVMVLVAALATFAFSIVWAFVGEYQQRVREHTESRQKWQAIAAQLRDDLDELRRIRTRIFSRRR
jgi:uncharacterized protein involved in exopolysaccharide biosynthesis